MAPLRSSPVRLRCQRGCVWQLQFRHRWKSSEVYIEVQLQIATMWFSRTYAVALPSGVHGSITRWSGGSVVHSVALTPGRLVRA